MCQGFRALRSPKAIGWRSGRQSALSLNTGVRCRRDQRAVCFAARAARRPVPLSTTPAPLHKPCARHERNFPHATRKRDTSVGGLASSLRLRGFTHFVPPASPSALGRQTPTEALWQNLIQPTREGRKSNGNSSTVCAKGDSQRAFRVGYGFEKPLCFETFEFVDSVGIDFAKHQSCAGCCASF